MTQVSATDSPNKRVKIFTIHGTFDHAAPWDNWDDSDSQDKPLKQRNFINRLKQRLFEQNVTLDRADHTEFNWSGGNSHDERRIAAIAFKNRIQQDLSDVYEKHGKTYNEYYDGGVFCIGHSHGGTVARLAMNLWDKRHDYHLPEQGAHNEDEIDHDDQCQVCKRTRGARFDPNVVSKPDGIITFGSPFIHFKKRKAGLLSARIFVWVLRCLALLPLAAFYFFIDSTEAAQTMQAIKLPYLSSAITLLWPLVAFWIIAIYLPGLVLRPINGRPLEGTPDRSNLLKTFSLASWVVYIAGLMFLGVYYLAYSQGGWAKAVEWMPILDNATIWFTMPLVLFAFLAIIAPSRLLSWMDGKVEGLRDKLPKKYDPRENQDSPTTYLCYRTPGDEAGLHLRIFGFITWLIQTLTLSASVVLAFGLGLLLLLSIEGLTWLGKGSLLEVFGVSPYEQTSSFIGLMNVLTYYPVFVCNWLLGWIPGVELVYLGNLENQDAVAQTVPLALVISVAIILIGLMPSILLAIALAYVVSMWLRGSGLVFGGEKFAWTLANKISANQRASDNANVRTVNVAPEAWWNMEMAHCYFYKSDFVIKDVAEKIASWGELAPNRDWPLVSILGRVAQWMVVAFFVLSIFAVSVSVANSMVTGVFDSINKAVNGPVTEGTSSSSTTVEPTGNQPPASNATGKN